MAGSIWRRCPPGRSADSGRVDLLPGGLAGDGDAGGPAGLSAGVFTEELTDQLLDEGAPHPLYQDVDGVLYALPTGRDRDATKGSTSFQVEMTGEDAYSVSVTVDLLEGPDGAVTGVERYAFPYEFVEDRWVFTDFRLIY